MPKVKISEYSATANSNTDVASINIDEGCAPSGINNAIRAVMGHLKDFQQGTYGDPFNGPHNGTVGVTTPSTGAFTTLTSNGATTFTAGTASTTTGTGTLVITGGLGVSGRINAANFDGIIGANTAAAGSFTTLSATGVTTVQAGTASLPAITTTGDTNTGIWFPAADTIAFTEGGVESMRIDSSGNLGLGVAPSAWASGYKAIQLTEGVAFSEGGGNTYLSNNWFYDGTNKYIANGTAAVYAQSGGTHAWYTAASGTAGNAITFTQAMTLDASGNLLVGTTSSLPSFANGRIEAAAAASSYGLVLDATASSASGIGIRGNDSTTALSFFNAQSGATVGTVVINSSSTSYNTSSDYRLKENIQPMTSALAKVAALKPCIYKWKADGSDGEGFIAHELAEVCPHAVTGEKDAVDADGNPKYQGIDTSYLVAILTAAIQEQQALITQLTARITALEGA
jgi:hypothetical protein